MIIKNVIVSNPFDTQCMVASLREKCNLISFEKMIDVSNDSPVKEVRSNTLYRNLVAGAIAGGVSRTFTAPFDRLKTVMQVSGNFTQFFYYSLRVNISKNLMTWNLGGSEDRIGTIFCGFSIV